MKLQNEPIRSRQDINTALVSPGNVTEEERREALVACER